VKPIQSPSSEEPISQQSITFASLIPIIEPFVVLAMTSPLPHVDSLLGRWIYVCNCGPQCSCGHRSSHPSHCPCGDDSVLRRVLAEDELHFYVSQTGVDDPSNEMGQVPFHCTKGRPLQGFPKLWQPAEASHDGDEDYEDGWGRSSKDTAGEKKGCCGS
jgi:hypothetical protein